MIIDNLSLIAIATVAVITGALLLAAYLGRKRLRERYRCGTCTPGRR